MDNCECELQSYTYTHYVAYSILKCVRVNRSISLLIANHIVCYSYIAILYSNNGRGIGYFAPFGRWTRFRRLRLSRVDA